MGEITDIARVAAKHGVREIALSGWEPGEEFVCRAKRPTLYNMAATGHVPNPLLAVVRTMFEANPKAIDEAPVAEQAKAMLQMAKYALVEPTYDEISKAGLTLTDDQLTQIYVYAIGGATALEPFRALAGGGPGGHGGDVPDAAQPPDENK